MRARKLEVRIAAGLIAGMVMRVPAALAQPMEAASPEIARDVTAQVDRLLQDVAMRDPELAQEMERQADLVTRDLGDGRLDSPEFTRDIEGIREAHDMMGRVMETEVEGRISELQSAGKGELAADLQRAMEAWRSGGEMPQGEMMRAFEPGQGPADFEQPEGFRPTPELMEQMKEVFGEVMKEMGDDQGLREFAGVAGEGMIRDFFEHADFGTAEAMRQGPEGEFRGGPEMFREMGEGMPGGPSPEMLREMAEMPGGPGAEFFREFQGPAPEFMREFELDHEGFDHDPLHEMYRDFEQSFRDLVFDRELTTDQRQELLADLQVTVSDIQNQIADPRFNDVLNASEANLSVAERDQVLNSTPVHNEFFAEVDPNQSGQEHLHVDYLLGTEGGGPHVDASVQIHDHQETADPSDDQFIGTITHVTDVEANGAP